MDNTFLSYYWECHTCTWHFYQFIIENVTHMYDTFLPYYYWECHTCVWHISIIIIENATHVWHISIIFIPTTCLQNSWSGVTITEWDLGGHQRDQETQILTSTSQTLRYSPIAKAKWSLREPSVPGPAASSESSEELRKPYAQETSVSGHCTAGIKEPGPGKMVKWPSINRRGFC